MSYLPGSDTLRYAYDSWKRADSLVGWGTADSGQVWSDVSTGGWIPGILARQAYPAHVGGGGFAAEVLETNVADGVCQSVQLAAGSGVGLLHNWIDINNNYELVFTFPTTYTIYRVFTGVVSVLKTALTGGPVVGDFIGFSRLGKSLTYWKNGIAIASVDDVGALITGTQYGPFLNSLAGDSRAAYYNVRAF